MSNGDQPELDFFNKLSNALTEAVQNANDTEQALREIEQCLSKALEELAEFKCPGYEKEIKETWKKLIRAYVLVNKLLGQTPAFKNEPGG